MDNTAVGYYSLRDNTTGSNNTAVGSSALFRTTGSYNTAVGVTSLAGGGGSTGSNNTSTGYASLSNNTANDNTAMGYQALQFITTGGYNIGFGSNAGRWLNNGVTTNSNASSSIYIGYDARSLVASSINEIVIGSTALGNGSNSVTLGNNNITKTLLKGNIGIGTTTPNYKLSVNGELGFEPQGISSSTYKVYSGAIGNIISSNRLIFTNTTGTDSRYWFDSLSSGGAGSGISTAESGIEQSFLGSFESAIRLVAMANKPFKIDVGTQAGDANTKLTIDTTGNVGIGTTTPSQKLQVMGSIRMSGSHLINDGEQVFNVGPTGNFYFRKNTTSGDPTAFTDLMFISNLGRVGIGTTTPSQALELVTGSVKLTRVSAARQNLQWDATSQGLGSYYMGINNSGEFNISDPTNYNAQNGLGLNIINGGNVGIGTVSPGYTLTVSGTAWVTGNAWSGSDFRWKTNITPITSALDKVMQLSGVSYNWRQAEFPERNFDNKTHLGFIAQEVETVLPELVITGADGYKGLDYNGMTSVLVNAVKELNTRTSALSSATTSPSIIVMNNGFVGIGTSTPMSKFHVFSNVSSGGVAVFQDNNARCTVDPTNGGMSCSSDQNLKKDITTLEATTTLNKLMQLRPVSYRWNGEDSNTTTSHQGFIAQEVETIFPEFVSTDSNGIKSINYSNFVPAMISAIQTINARVNAIDQRLISVESALALDSSNQSGDIISKITTWLADATNGITSIIAGTFKAKDEICVDDQCLNKDTVRSLLALVGTSTSVQYQSGSEASTTTDTTLPTVSILGNNPATITVGATYSDMGATVTDTNADGTINTNLGLHYNVDGVEVALVSIDTSTTTSHTIVYSSVDGAGNTGYATRTVEVIQ